MRKFTPGITACSVHRQCANSVAYQDFWSRLSKGEFINDRFLRLDKQGREIWLEASYNPVRDASGQVIKVVKIAD